MSNIVLGLGDAAGMLYHAPNGTALPATAATAPGADWTEIGLIDHDGASFSKDQSTEEIKSWDNKVRRVILTDHSEKVQFGVIDTDEEPLETIFGDDAVTVVAATTTHGKQISVNLSEDALPDPEAFLLVMKDGDHLMMLGTTSGQVTAIEGVDFKPDGAVTWKPTITAIEPWTLLTDDGKKTTI